MLKQPNMKVLQINAVYGTGSTGTIVKDIENLCFQSDIECYVASPDKAVLNARHGYKIGNIIDYKLHALLSRIHGMQAYFSDIPTNNLLKWIEQIKPDIVHLHNLHNNYIHLNHLMSFLANKDIRTIITLHDCWFFTGGCSHFTSIHCNKWLDDCTECPRQKEDTPALFIKHSDKMLADRKRFINAIPRLTIVGASKWIASECKKSVLSSCKNICYIHNGFDLNIFKPTNSNIREQLNLEGKYVILAPASKWYLPINKSALDYFVAHLPSDTVMVLFGGNQTHNSSYSNIIEIGHIYEPKKMAELYSMADVLVNCTREDTLSGINIECQACGTPVITYDSTGCRETVDEICSKTVSVGDYKQLLEYVNRIRSIGKPFLTEQCVKWCSTHFELKDSYTHYLDLYKKVLED